MPGKKVVPSVGELRVQPLEASGGREETVGAHNSYLRLHVCARGT